MADLQRLVDGMNIHLDHYQGLRSPWVCIGANGIEQTFVCTDGQYRGETVTAIDASGAYGSACLGADHPDLRSAVVRSMAADGYVTDEVGSEIRSELLLDLFGPEGLWASAFPSSEYHVSGRNSGSEGMELALRLVHEHAFDFRSLRRRSGWEERHLIVCFEGAWHGWTGGVRHLLNRRHFRIGLPDSGSMAVAFLPFGEPSAFREFIDQRGDQIAAVVIEPVQGDAGILLPPEGYLREVASLIRDAGALLIADEVLTFAKTGQFFAMTDAQGHIPTDITVIGKSLGMGLISQSMVMARRHLLPRASGSVATSDLRPLPCAIMRAGLDIIREHRLLERSEILGRKLRDNLTSRVLKTFPHIVTALRGVGFLNGLELSHEAAAQASLIRQELLRAGVYLELMAGAGRRSHGLPFVPPVLRIAPPLVADEEALDTMVDRIELGLESFAAKGLAA